MLVRLALIINLLAIFACGSGFFYSLYRIHNDAAVDPAVSNRWVALASRSALLTLALLIIMFAQYRLFVHR